MINSMSLATRKMFIKLISVQEMKEDDVKNKLKGI